MENSGVNGGDLNNGPGLSGSAEIVEVMYFHGETPDGYKFTIAGVVEDDDLLLGIAMCANGDMFNRAKGRAIASGRVLNQRENPKGRSRISLYSHDLNTSYHGEVGFPENYFKGKEIKVFREIVRNYNFFTKRELQREFHINYRCETN